MRRILGALHRITGGSIGRESVSAESRIVSAHDELLSLQKSQSVRAEIDDVVRLPLKELNAKPRAELTKLAGYAYHGVGTEKDVDKATALWVCAAMKGDAEATYNVAMCYKEGKGEIPKDEAKARELFESLARQGHAWSQFALATDLAQSEDKSFAPRVFELYKSAAEKGVAPACLNLSNMYNEGIGTKRNPAKAVKWLQEAARAGDPHAQLALGRRLATGESVVKDEDKAFALFSMAAESGRPAALYNVGCAYLMGRGVDKDFIKAATHFEQSAKGGFFPAQVNLGQMYYSGQGVPRNLEMALFWYQEGARQFDTAQEMVDRIKAEIVAEESLEGGLDTGAAGESKSQGFVFESKSTNPGAETLEASIDIVNPAYTEDILAAVNDADGNRADVMKVLKEFEKEGKLKIRMAGIAREE